MYIIVTYISTGDNAVDINNTVQLIYPGIVISHNVHKPSYNMHPKINTSPTFSQAWMVDIIIDSYNVGAAVCELPPICRFANIWLTYFVCNNIV